MGFALLITNAWLGSLVVATNLLPGMVSLHFLLSFLCLFAFIRAVQEVRPIIKHHNISEKRNWRVLWILIFTSCNYGDLVERTSRFIAFNG